MPEAVINREVTVDQVAEAIRSTLGGDVEVTHDGPDLTVRQGYMKRAKVQVHPASGSTTATVTGATPPGLLLALFGKASNSRTFAPQVACAIERGLASSPGA